MPVPSAVPTAVPVPGAPGIVTGLTQSLIDRINQFAFPAQNNGSTAPPCKKQGNFHTSGESTRFPHLKAK